MDRDTTIQTVRTAFEHTDVAVSCSYLFGSVARGEATTASDVDVAVLFSETPPPTLLGPVATLQGELEEALRREVDLVVLNRSGPDLTHRVLRDGELLVENDRSHRIRFEVDSRNAYFDLLPYLREYRRGRVA
ncbi:type VII toxin-antitoxin system MntA family adenylyltransferase antitoxin [Endothiovibrio diazotrophicus]